MSRLFNSFDDYDFRHWVSIQAEAGDHESIHRIFAHRGYDLRNSWYEIRERRSELSGYVGDVGIAWSLVKPSVTTQSADAVALQLRYALIIGVIRDLADCLRPGFLARCVETGLWRREQALTWVRLSHDPQTSLKLVVEELRRDSGEGREELGRLAISIGSSIRDADGKVLAVAGLAGDIPAYLLRQALEVIEREQNEGSRLGGLRSLVGKLPDSLKHDALEMAKRFKQSELRMEAIALVAAQLDEPQRSGAFDEFFAEARALLNTSSNRIAVQRLATILPPEQFQELGKLLDPERYPHEHEDFVHITLKGLIERDPSRVRETAKLLSSEWKADELFMGVAQVFAQRGLYSDAAETAADVSTYTWNRNPDVLSVILKELPESEWPRWEPILDKMTDSTLAARIQVLRELGKSMADRDRLSRLISQFCRDESEKLEVRAAAAKILTDAEREELLTLTLHDNPSIGKYIVGQLVPFLSEKQVHAAIERIGAPDLLDNEPLRSLLIRLAGLGCPEDALEILAELHALDSERAEIAEALAPHITSNYLQNLRDAIRPKNIARSRARALCTLASWLPAGRVNDIAVEVCRLEDLHDRVRLLNEFIIVFPLANIEEANRTLLRSLDEFIPSPSNYRDELLDGGFRALSRSLALSPSFDIGQKAIALASREEFNANGQISLLMNLVEAGGYEPHVKDALTTAFRLAGDDYDLVSLISQGLSSRHSAALSELAGQQSSDEEIVAFLVGASHFLTSTAKESALKRISEIANLGLRLVALEALLPELQEPTLTTAVSGEIENLPRWEANPKLFVPLMCLITRLAPSAASRYSEQLWRAFERLSTAGKVLNAGCMIEALGRAPEIMAIAWLSANQLKEEQKPAAFSELTPWMDRAQIEVALKLFVEQERTDEQSWVPLLRRASQLDLPGLITEALEEIGNEMISSDFIEAVAPSFTSNILSWISMRLENADRRDRLISSFHALSSLALRAAELGKLDLALDFIRYRGSSRHSGDDTLERIFELAPASWADRLIEFSESLYESEQPVVLSKLVGKVGLQQRSTLIPSIFSKLLAARGITSETRLAVVRELAPYLMKLSKLEVASTWNACLEHSSEIGREEVFADVCGFAPILVHHFGSEVASKLADAITVGGTEHWP